MSRRLRYTCGAPEGKCTGSVTKMTKGWRGSPKAHASREEAFRCYAAYLLSEGYTQLSAHEFVSPDGGPILVLSRISQFGGVLRTGKVDRYMPKRASGIVY